MKISEMSTDQAAEVLVRITQPAANIIDDPEVEPMIKQLADSKELPTMKIISTFIPKVVTLALKKHRNDLYEIVGALAQVDANKVGKMPVLQVMQIIKDSVDQDLIDFFRSFGGQKATAEKE